MHIYLRQEITRSRMSTQSGAAPMEKKSINSPDEVRTFDKGKLELTTFTNGITIGRITLEPGWSWEKCVKPIVKTNSCEAPHTLRDYAKER